MVTASSSSGDVAGERQPCYESTMSMTWAFVILALTTALACERAGEDRDINVTPSPLTEIEVPRVQGVGVVPITQDAVRVEATPTYVEIAGDRVALAGVDPSAIAAKLRPYFARHQAKSTILLVDREMTYEILGEILWALAPRQADGVAGAAKVSLAVRVKGQHNALPLQLPEVRQASVGVAASEAKPGDAVAVDLKSGESPPEWVDPVMPVVSILSSESCLWSLTGLEGTAAQPKKCWKRHEPRAVGLAVAEIVARRYAVRRPQEAHSIIIMAGRKVTVQRVADIVDAVRPSFPMVALSRGL